MAQCSELSEHVQRIRTLPDDVVRKIAAGEIVIRPLNAVKELIENSLDAGATEISVTCKNGGLDLIKVKDNGCGINSADYEHVCERFATSKLRTADDLSRMRTFGFRGEALSAISCMAKVQVVSRTSNSSHAWTVTYQDGKPLSPPVPKSGLVGTQITVENLFQGHRRHSGFKRPDKESSEIADVLVKYAINFPKVKVSFARDDGNKKYSMSSLGNGDQHSVIRLLMLSHLTKHLYDFEVDSQKYKFNATICMARPLSRSTSTAAKAKNEKMRAFHLFVNDRLVTFIKLEHAIDTVFSEQGIYCPFMHVSIHVDPVRIDVNVNPTKDSILFRDEVQIIECVGALKAIVEDFLQTNNTEMGSARRSSRANDTSTAASLSAPNECSPRGLNLDLDISSVSEEPTVSRVLGELIMSTPCVMTPKSSLVPMRPSTSDEISPIERNSSGFNLGQKRRLDSTTNSVDAKMTPTSSKIMRTTLGSDIFGDDIPFWRRNTRKPPYVPGMANNAFSSNLSSPSTRIRVDPTDRSIREFLTPKTVFNESDRGSLPPGDTSFFDESGRGSLPSGEVSFYAEVADDSHVNASFGDESIAPGDKDGTFNSTADLTGERVRYSLKALEEVEKEACAPLKGLLHDFVLIGFVDVFHLLFQSGMGAYQLEILPVLEEMFYQKCLRPVDQSDSRRLILNSSQFPNGMPLVALVDTHLRDCPDAQLPNSSKHKSKNDAVDELVLKAGSPEIIKFLWNEFGLAIKTNENDGPILSEILIYSKKYDPLISEQISKFGYELVCTDWSEPVIAAQQVARAIARLHTPYQIEKCQEKAGKQQYQAIRDHLLCMLKRDFLVPDRLNPFFKKVISTSDASKIFGRC